MSDLQPTVSQAQGADATLGPRPAASLAPPSELADHPRYRVIKLLGKGGMGAVYLAEHRVMQRPVALKVISPALVNQPGAVERFQREIWTAAKLVHPNIVTAYDAEQVGGLHFFVMEFVEGTSLDRYVARKGPLPVPFACSFVRQAALGLQHGFEKGMVHRDIKPHNLMLTPKGRVKVLDFGLARFASERGSDGGLTGANVVMGTPDYIAPEQANDAHSADTRADIYSLGCTLYHLLTGHAPFADAAGLNKLMSHVERTPPPVTDVRDDIPPDLFPILDRMLAKKPAERYQTPAEVAKALTPFVTAAAAPQSDVVPLWRRPWVWIAAGVAAFALLVVGLVALRPWKKTETAVANVVAAPEPTAPAATPTLAAPAPAPTSTTKTNVPAVAPVEPPPPKPGRLGLEGDIPANLVIRHDKELVGVLDPDRREIDLPPGTYDIDFAAVRPTLRLSSKRVAVASGRATRVSITREPGVFAGHTGHVVCVALSDHFALTGGPNGELFLWDLDKEELLHKFTGHTGYVRGVAFSPAGRTALSVGDDKLLHHWNTAERKEEQPALPGHFESIYCVAFVNDRQALTGSADQAVRLWDLRAGKSEERFKKHGRGVTAVAIWPKDRDWALSASSAGNLRFWSMVTASEQLTLPDETTLRVQLNSQGPHAVRTISVSPLDNYLVLTAGNGGARLHDLRKKDPVKTLKADMGNVHAALFLPDSKRAVTASQDGNVRLWNVGTGQELECFKGHSGEVRALALSRDGKLCVSVGNDKTLRVWKLPEAEKAK